MDSIHIEYELYQTLSPIPSAAYQLALSGDSNNIPLGYILSRDYLQSTLENETPFDRTSYIIFNGTADVTKQFLYQMAYYVDLFRVYSLLNNNLLSYNVQPDSIVIQLSGNGYLDLETDSLAITGSRLTTTAKFYYKGDVYAQ